MNVMIKELEKDCNKEYESNTCLFSDSEKERDTEKRKLANKRHRERRKIMRPDKIRKKLLNQRHIKNLSDYTPTTDRGLKFIPTPFLEEKLVKQQMLQDFKLHRPSG